MPQLKWRLSNRRLAQNELPKVRECVESAKQSIAENNGKKLARMRKLAKIIGGRIVKRTISRTNSGARRKTNVNKNFHYPERTEGSRHARELRERTNEISDKQREGLLERAMRRMGRIYGGSVKATVGTSTGH